MYKNRAEKFIAVVTSVIRIEEMIKDSIIPNELIGDCVVIDAEKILSQIKSLKDNITDSYSVELGGGKNSRIFNPLRILVNTMNNGRERDTDESETTDVT